MDANQQSRSNPFGMDEECTNCDALCETREQVVHGYGDVGADFMFIAERPWPGADQSGVPFYGDESGDRFFELLEELGLATGEDGEDGPVVENVYLTHLTRCRHPDRSPGDQEVMQCEPFLNAEIRMINPEILVPVGQRALVELATEYTTKRPDDFDVDEAHATTIRGRGFELAPAKDFTSATEAEIREFGQAFADLMGTDYRQTKGRRGR